MVRVIIEIQSKLLLKKMSFHLYVNPTEIKSEKLPIAS